MRTAVISDIHANLEALRSVLERVRTLKADEIVCLGDSVGYNADPNECIELLKREKVVCMLGNHDAAAAGLKEPEDFNPLAKAALLWTRDRLTEESRRFLLGLPREQRIRDFFLLHGSIHDTNRYILSRDDAVENFRMLAGMFKDVRIGFFGHTHVRTVLIEQGDVISTALVPEDIELVPEKRYLINPGSVGQPRDGDPRAGFLMYDSNQRQVLFHREEYDIRACQEKILRAGLPVQLAERLEWGR